MNKCYISPRATEDSNINIDDKKTQLIIQTIQSFPIQLIGKLKGGWNISYWTLLIYIWK